MNVSSTLRSGLSVAFATLGALATVPASAAVFTPKFNDFFFPGTQFTVDAAANSFFNTSYGITIDNAYLYVDSRDTFDGIGVANGTTAVLDTPNQSGRVNFIDTTDFVTVEYLAIRSTVYSAFSASNTLLSTFTPTALTGTFTLNGTSGAEIAYLTFTSTGGYGTISGLTYNYDGVTGGGNTDLPGTTPPVPEPETYALMLAGLAALGLVARRRKN